MDPLTAGTMIGAPMGTLISGLFNRDAANNQMNFQMNMANTAHQREVADLRAAGLNPILSALGSGSAVPTGAAGQMGDLGQGISTGASTALAVRQQKEQFKQIGATVGNLEADTANKEKTGGLIDAQTVATAAQARVAQAEANLKTGQYNLLSKTMEAQVKKAIAEGNYAELNQIFGLVNSATSSASNVLGGFAGKLLEQTLGKFKTNPKSIGF